MASGSGVKDMAAISVLPNPMKPENALYWWNGADGELKLTQRPFSDKADKSYKAPTQFGSLKNPSSIVAFMHQDLVYTFGIKIDYETLRTGDMTAITSNSGTIYGLSPTLEQLGSDLGNVPYLCQDKRSKGALAGTSSGEEAWVYYLNDQNTLVEYLIGNGVTTKVNFKPLISTYLAAVFDTDKGHRYLIYQNANDNSFILYNVNTRSSTPVFGSDKLASPGSPVTACYYKKRIYVYFTDDKQNIWRNSKPTDGSFDARPSQLDEAKSPTAFTQMCVTPSGNKLQLFYLGISGGLQKFIQYVDVPESS